jgi:hypothetical protein
MSHWTAFGLIEISGLAVKQAAGPNVTAMLPLEVLPQGASGAMVTPETGSVKL